MDSLDSFLICFEKSMVILASAAYNQFFFGLVYVNFHTVLLSAQIDLV